MAQNKMSMPSGFGGLMRYDEEVESKFKIKPVHVIAFVLAIILGSILIRIL
jgi:preprotein translocase subunit Sec61beta